MAIALVILAGAAAPASAATIVNGGFETGDFTGWTVVNQRRGSGDWFVYRGAHSPLTGFSVHRPARGTYAAITDMFAPGSHAMYQDITLEPGLQHILRFFIYYQNLAGEFGTPDTLSFAVPECNQQYRVDILEPDSGPFSVKPDDLLATLFLTDRGDPLTLEPTQLQFDITQYAAQTIRLRFAEVDNQNFFLASVDEVGVVSKSP